MRAKVSSISSVLSIEEVRRLLVVHWAPSESVFLKIHPQTQILATKPHHSLENSDLIPISLKPHRRPNNSIIWGKKRKQISPKCIWIRLPKRNLSLKRQQLSLEKRKGIQNMRICLKTSQICEKNKQNLLDNNNSSQNKEWDLHLNNCKFSEVEKKDCVIGLCLTLKERKEKVKVDYRFYRKSTQTILWFIRVHQMWCLFIIISNLRSHRETIMENILVLLVIMGQAQETECLKPQLLSTKTPHLKSRSLRRRNLQDLTCIRYLHLVEAFWPDLLTRKTIIIYAVENLL